MGSILSAILSRTKHGFETFVAAPPIFDIASESLMILLYSVWLETCCVL